jgi:hypothetical protein
MQRKNKYREISILWKPFCDHLENGGHFDNLRWDHNKIHQLTILNEKCNVCCFYRKVNFIHHMVPLI